MSTIYTGVLNFFKCWIYCAMECGSDEINICVYQINDNTIPHAITWYPSSCNQVLVIR